MPYDSGLYDDALYYGAPPGGGTGGRGIRWGIDPWGGGWGYTYIPFSDAVIADFRTNYRLVLAERSSTGLGAELVPDVLGTAGVPYGGQSVMRWKRQLNGAGSLEFTLPTTGEGVTEATYAPGQRELHLYRDDGGGEFLVWAGHLWVADVDHDWVRFMGLGWYETLRHREMAEDFYRVDAGQLDIAWELINYTQSQTGGNIGVTRFPGSTGGVARTVLYCAEERQSIASAVEDLADADTGFDWEVTPTKRWKVWTPERGTDLSASVLLDAASTVSNLSYQVDATQVANEVAGIGERTDCEPIHYDREIDTTSRGDYGLMQTSVVRSDIRQDAERISALARKELKLRKRARRLPAVGYPAELGGPLPMRGDFDIGDTVGLQASNGYATFDDPFRVMAYEVTVNRMGREFVTLDLDAAVT